jgi:galactose mutarotase-like enzyme
LFDPGRFEATIAHPAGAFLDRFHGGWQEIFPGGGPVNYRGADLGLHGEVTHLGWDYDILQDTPECIEVRMSVDCVRTPFRLERVMRIEKGNPALFLDETVTNLSSQTLDFMWGHHPSFGAPFLKQGVRLFIPTSKVEVTEPRFANSSILTPGAVFDWPHALAGERSLDLSQILGPDGGFSELLYLQELRESWYALVDPQQAVGFGLAWEKEMFPYVWFWSVYGESPDYPWWNRVYCVALEPWTSIPNDLSKAMQRGTQKVLRGGESIQTSLCAVAISGREEVKHISIDGKIL